MQSCHKKNYLIKKPKKVLWHLCNHKLTKNSIYFNYYLFTSLIKLLILHCKLPQKMPQKKNVKKNKCCTKIFFAKKKRFFFQRQQCKKRFFSLFICGIFRGNLQCKMRSLHHKIKKIVNNYNFKQKRLWQRCHKTFLNP